jgi:hypothetical protein
MIKYTSALNKLPSFGYFIIAAQKPNQYQQFLIWPQVSLEENSGLWGSKQHLRFDRWNPFAVQTMVSSSFDSQWRWPTMGVLRFRLNVHEQSNSWENWTWQAVKSNMHLTTRHKIILCCFFSRLVQNQVPHSTHFSSIDNGFEGYKERRQPYLLRTDLVPFIKKLHPHPQQTHGVTGKGLSIKAWSLVWWCWEDRTFKRCDLEEGY